MMPAQPAQSWQRVEAQWWYLRESGQVTWAWSEDTGYWYPFDASSWTWGPARYASEGYQPLVEVAMATE